MNKEAVTINKVNVTINAIRVEGKRMTKMVFEQIPTDSYIRASTMLSMLDPDSEEYDPEIQILGYTASDEIGHPVLYVVAGELRRFGVYHVHAYTDYTTNREYREEQRALLDEALSKLPYLYIGA